MSKQSEAKAAQGYKVGAACCKTCANFSSMLFEVPHRYGGGTWVKESSKRCDIGGFAVQSSGHCRLWVIAAEAQ